MTPDDRLTAAEWVIGLLPPEEMAAATARIERDPDFADEVAWWQERLASLLGHYREVAPPAYLADRIVAALDAPDVRHEKVRRLHWRSAMLGAALGALAASFVGWMVVPATVEQVPAPTPVRPARVLVARLAWATGEQAPAPVAIVQPDLHAVRVAGAVDVPRDRVAQLWRIPAGGAPVSLGLLAATDGQTIALRAANVPVAGSTLAISIEPRGGSPSGQPTGPVVAAGPLAAL